MPPLSLDPVHSLDKLICRRFASLHHYNGMPLHTLDIDGFDAWKSLQRRLDLTEVEIAIVAAK